MSLRDYQPPTRTIQIGNGKSFVVRALGFDDMQRLVIERHGLVDTALMMFGEKGLDAASAPDNVIRDFAATLLAQLPGLSAELIATAANEPDMAPIVKRLPGPMQLEALEAIYLLTFPEPGDLGKFFGRLASLTSSIPRPNLQAMVSPSSNGSGGSNLYGVMSPS